MTWEYLFVFTGQHYHVPFSHCFLLQVLSFLKIFCWNWHLFGFFSVFFTVIILSFMAFSMTGNIIWVMWLSKSSNIGLSFTIFMLNHLANTSESIHPKYWKWTIIFVNLVTIWLHLIFNINMKQFDLAIQFEILLSCRFVNSTTETEPLNRYYWKGFNKELAEQLPKIYLCI